MAWIDAMAPAIAAHKERVMQATWGHLAPKRNKTYQGRIVWAVGCYGKDHTPLVCEFDDLDDSPWFYDAMTEFLWAQECESGCVYEFIGTFRNFNFKGKVRTIFNANKEE